MYFTMEQIWEFCIGDFEICIVVIWFFNTHQFWTILNTCRFWIQYSVSNLIQKKTLLLKKYQLKAQALYYHLPKELQNANNINIY